MNLRESTYRIDQFTRKYRNLDCHIKNVTEEIIPQGGVIWSNGRPLCVTFGISSHKITHKTLPKTHQLTMRAAVIPWLPWCPTPAAKAYSSSLNPWLSFPPGGGGHESDAMPLQLVAEDIVGAGWFTFYLASTQVKKTKTIYLARHFISPVANTDLKVRNKGKSVRQLKSAS